MDEGVMQACISNDSKLECYEVLNEDDIVSPVACGSEEITHLKERPKSDERNFDTHKK